MFTFGFLTVTPLLPFFHRPRIAVELGGAVCEGDVDLLEVLKVTEHSDDCRDIAHRNALQIVNLFHYRKSVDPVRIGLRLLADEGSVPSAELLDLLVCV